MKLRLHLLLLLALLGARMASAQTPAAAPSRPAPVLPKLPETSLQPAMSTTSLPPANGTRFQYQQVRLYNDQCVYLAPAWRGQTRLAPVKTKLLAGVDPGELDGMLLTTLNELAEDGWELVEIQTSMQPIGAKQKLETSYTFHDPQRPEYTGTTRIESLSQTRYLFRRPIQK